MECQYLPITYVLSYNVHYLCFVNTYQYVIVGSTRSSSVSCKAVVVTIEIDSYCFQIPKTVAYLVQSFDSINNLHGDKVGGCFVDRGFVGLN